MVMPVPSVQEGTDAFGACVYTYIYIYVYVCEYMRVSQG